MTCPCCAPLDPSRTVLEQEEECIAHMEERLRVARHLRDMILRDAGVTPPGPRLVPKEPGNG